MCDTDPCQASHLMAVARQRLQTNQQEHQEQQTHFKNHIRFWKHHQTNQTKQQQQESRATKQQQQQQQKSKTRNMSVKHSTEDPNTIFEKLEILGEGYEILLFFNRL